MKIKLYLDRQGVFLDKITNSMSNRIPFKIMGEIGVQEKYIRKEHYNTLKTWWARRPVTTMRSLLINEMLERKNQSYSEIDLELVTELNPSNKQFNKFSQQFETKDISVLDVFAGGGSIPFESARLGFNTYSAELNPVASLLQETIFNSLSIGDFSDKLDTAGTNVIKRLQNKIGKYFQIDGVKPYVIFWSKVAQCKQCQGPLDLRRLEYLAKKKNKTVRIVEGVSGLEIINSDGNGEGLKKEFECPNCKSLHSFSDIKHYCKNNSFKHSPFAICYEERGKKYKIVTEEEKSILVDYEKEIDTVLRDLKALLPKGTVKLKGGVINPTLYDLKKHQDFFTKRQLLVLLSLIQEIIDEHASLVKKHGASEAKQITLALTALIEFLVDWNSVSTMWICQNEQTGRSLAGPGVGMKWDFIEVNPFATNGSNLSSKLKRVCETYRVLSINNSVNIIRGSSTNLPLDDSSIDVVLTDPPYYDSVDYTGLSEFFRPWFEIVVHNTFDSEINLVNDDRFEAIVELSTKSKKDNDHYEQTMSGVAKEVNRVLKPNGTFLMLFSHKTFEGWKVIANAFRNAKMYVSECIPLEMERIARPRAMASEALNGVIVFKLKKSDTAISSIESDISKLKDELRSGDILDSQVVIYLAALACKLSTIRDLSYEESYEETIKIYETIRLEQWANGHMDIITKSYLEAKLKGTLESLGHTYLSVLKDNSLIDANNNLKPLQEIQPEKGLSGTLLDTAITLYKDYKYNSKTKVQLELSDAQNMKLFFSIISGSQLNTVSKRSSSEEVKTARLILAKIN